MSADGFELLQIMARNDEVGGYYVFDPGVFAALIFAFADDHFATAILFKTAFGFAGSQSCAGANVAIPIGIAQFALKDLAAGLTGQRVEELDVLWNLKICKASAQEILHGGR